MEFLDFEQPIKELMEQYEKCAIVGEESGVDVSATCKQIEEKIIKTKKKIYGNLTPWQRVQLSRHPDRPYTLDYIHGIADEGSVVELHGDRCFADDPAMIGAMIKINGQSVMVIGTQKGRTTKERQYRRFGMSNPDGYRKALRLMKFAGAWLMLWHLNWHCSSVIASSAYDRRIRAAWCPDEHGMQQRKAGIWLGTRHISIQS